MAQVTGTSTFDVVARHKRESAQRVLARAADLWAGHGRDSLSVDSVVAVMLRIYLSLWHQHGNLHEKSHSLETWLPLVGSPEQEANSLIFTVVNKSYLQNPPAKPAADAQTICQVLDLLRGELAAAAEQWLRGYPEQPPTAHAINVVEHILFTHKLSRRPADPKLPTTLCHV